MSEKISDFKEKEPSRMEADRLITGRGRYLDSFKSNNLLHAAFVRSNRAVGKINNINISKAISMPGVFSVFTAKDLMPFVVAPPVVKLDNFPSHISPPQLPLVEEYIRYQGEPIALVVAETFEKAQDAIDNITIEISETDQNYFENNIPNKNNLASEVEAGNNFIAPEDNFNFEKKFSFARQTGVTLEPRGIVASYDLITSELEVLISHQSPHLVQVILASVLGIPENSVRVKVGDVGGGFGVKLHLYPDEIATVLAARILGQSVKYVVTRMEAFQSDAQAREFSVSASISLTEDGKLSGFEGDFENYIGAYSIFPRSSIGDSVQAGTQLGAAYKIDGMRSKSRTFWQNKPPSGAIRGVGQPIPCTVTEQLIDIAARHLGEDPVAFRRRNYYTPKDYPVTTHGGILLEHLSLVECLDLLVEKMSYTELREEQRTLRERGFFRGIGVATFIEQTAVGPGLYGPSGVPVTSIEEAKIRLEADGSVRLETGATDQGQGTLTGIQQIVAASLGLTIDRIKVLSGDSFGARGGGAWASRGLSLAGEAAILAAEELKTNIKVIAGSLLQVDPDTLELAEGQIRVGDNKGIKLSDLSQMVWYQPYNLPDGAVEMVSVSRSYTLKGRQYLTSNGIQGSLVEVDTETGEVKLLKHWVVEDCGNIVNNALVDGQIIGGTSQGIGPAISENCLYDDTGQLTSGSFLDYAIPRAVSMPPIEVYHFCTPQKGTLLGTKGVGEAGTIGAPAAIWCAVNDALHSLGASVDSQPITPEVVLNAISKASCGNT